jgi:hypothetical protein
MKFENLKTRTANELGVLLRHWRAVKASSTCLSTRVCRKSRSASSRADGASPVVRLWWSSLRRSTSPCGTVTRCCSRAAMPRSIPRATGTHGNEKCDRRPKAHSAPAGAFSGNGDGPLLERAHDERMRATFFQLLHRYDCARGSAKHVHRESVGRVEKPRHS